MHNRRQRRKVEREFRKMANFPEVIGALDGCYFRIHPPSKKQNGYRNYKKFFSIKGTAADNHKK